MFFVKDYVNFAHRGQAYWPFHRIETGSNVEVKSSSSRVKYTGAYAQFRPCRSRQAFSTCAP